LAVAIFVMIYRKEKNGLIGIAPLLYIKQLHLNNEKDIANYPKVEKLHILLEHECDTIIKFEAWDQ
jgi:hypothetical protein